MALQACLKVVPGATRGIVPASISSLLPSGASSKASKCLPIFYQQMLSPALLSRDYHASEQLNNKEKPPAPEQCGDAADDEDSDDEMEVMIVDGPSGPEWNGPTRGGRLPEPTRYGDWERKGRCVDF